MILKGQLRIQPGMSYIFFFFFQLSFFLPFIISDNHQCIRGQSFSKYPLLILPAEVLPHSFGIRVQHILPESHPCFGRREEEGRETLCDLEHKGGGETGEESGAKIQTVRPTGAVGDPVAGHSQETW